MRQYIHIGYISYYDQLRWLKGSMKAELLKRLFRAIASSDTEAVQNLLPIVVEEERQKGRVISF